jgi:hypothetical protein
MNDAPTVLGMSAKNADGVVMGQEVLKLSPVLMTLGKDGVRGSGTDHSTGRPARADRRSPKK